MRILISLLLGGLTAVYLGSAVLGNFQALPPSDPTELVLRDEALLRKEEFEAVLDDPQDDDDPDGTDDTGTFGTDDASPSPSASPFASPSPSASPSASPSPSADTVGACTTKIADDASGVGLAAAGPQPTPDGTNDTRNTNDTRDRDSRDGSRDGNRGSGGGHTGSGGSDADSADTQDTQASAATADTSASADTGASADATTHSRDSDS